MYLHRAYSLRTAIKWANKSEVTSKGAKIGQEREFQGVFKLRLKKKLLARLAGIADPHY